MTKRELINALEAISGEDPDFLLSADGAGRLFVCSGEVAPADDATLQSQGFQKDEIQDAWFIDLFGPADTLEKGTG